MCGIAGIVLLGQQSARIDASHLSAMRDAMTHRGPDGAGIWLSENGVVGLAHRRLSIIDLSPSAAQPMSNAAGSVVVTFNGEIYNHLELRRQLVDLGYEFRTDHSDTEVLVHGYQEWGGPALVDRLEGDYAFGIWDARREKLFLARDRIGVKPVYFAFFGSRLLFASEIKGILECPGVTRDIEPIAMYHYLSFMTTPPPLTMFAGIYKLPAAHWMEVGLDSDVTAQRYWDAVPGKSGLAREAAALSPKAREDLYVREIRRRLQDSVQKRMMSDVPFGVFLSGGIDSTTNVALMNQYVTGKVETFSIGFRDDSRLNELDYARLAATRLNTNHHEILIDSADMMGYLSEMIYSQDEPIADWVCVPLYFVSKLTKDCGVTVVQVGEGSDEQFCGYDSYMAYLRLYHRYWRPFRGLLPAFMQRLIAGLGKGAARFWPGFEIYADVIDRAARNREHFWSGAMVYWDLIKERLVREGAIGAAHIDARVDASETLPRSYLEADSFQIIRSYRERLSAADPAADVLTRMIYNEFQLRLPELLLMRVDKITMSQSLEARVPFLDHKLVELTMDIPMRDKIPGNRPKYLLKKAVEGLIPDEIIHRKKMGFGAPMCEWLRGPFGDRARREILTSSILERGFFDVAYIEGLLDAHRASKRDNSLYIWILYNLFAWYDFWIGERKASGLVGT